MRFILPLFLSLLSINCHSQQEFGVTAADEFVAFNYVPQSSRGFGQANVNIGVLVNERRDLYSNVLVLAGGDIVGEVEKFNLAVGVNVGLVVPKNTKPSAIIDSGSFVALALRFGYIPRSESPMLLYLEIHSSPRILSFDSFLRTDEYELGYSINFLPSAKFEIGYQVLEIVSNKNKPKARLFEGIFIGFSGLF